MNSIKLQQRIREAHAPVTGNADPRAHFPIAQNDHDELRDWLDQTHL